jgi:hypothetical protein
MNKRKRTAPARDNPDNPFIAALRRSCPDGCNILFEVDSRPDHKRDLFITFCFWDAIPEIGFLVVKALLAGDRQIVRDLKDALKEADHFFSRDREKMLHKKVAKNLPGWIRSGKDSRAIKEEIRKLNNGQDLHPQQSSRLRKGFCLAKLPTGRPRKSHTKR